MSVSKWPSQLVFCSHEQLLLTPRMFIFFLGDMVGTTSTYTIYQFIRLFWMLGEIISIIIQSNSNYFSFVGHTLYSQCKIKHFVLEKRNANPNIVLHMSIWPGLFLQQINANIHSNIHIQLSLLEIGEISRWHTLFFSIECIKFIYVSKLWILNGTSHLKKKTTHFRYKN